MPELPEVETVRKGLDRALAGATIGEAGLRRKDLRIPFPPDFARQLKGRSIESVNRRAKYLLFTLSGGLTLIAHLGMSGRFLVEPDMPKRLGKHDHVVLKLTDGRAVIYNDARRFGLMTLAENQELSGHPLLSDLGPEPLGKNFSAAYLRRALAARKGPVKPAIMDQKLVVGVGNIYASEALFRANISPMRRSDEAATMADSLAGAIKDVLRDAIDSGGSSLRDFLHVSGDAGYFQHRFNVYDRAGMPCARCGAPIREARQAGRSTYWCASCQS